jgi:phytoene dehydrogenase-like protein
MSDPEESTVDVVVAGAGHNSLAAAAYIAAAGFSVLVLEARHIVGGNAVSEEHVPGFRFDTGASGHVLIQATDLMKNDELGLIAHGLQYQVPTPPQITLLPDGSSLTVHRDVEETAKEVAFFSKKDADAYRRLADEAKRLEAGQVEGSIGGDRDLSAEVERKVMRRAWDLIKHDFEDVRIRSWLCMEASMAYASPDQALSARFVYGGFLTRHAPHSWAVPMGGSGVLPDALRAAVERAGGRVEVNKTVSRILIEEGRAVGVECTDGTRYRATRAVLSSIHIKQLTEMLPVEQLPPAFVEAVDEYVTGPAIGVSYFGTTEAPKWRMRDGREVESMVAFMPGTLRESLGWGNRDLRGLPALRKSMMFSHTGTVMDPSRVDGEGHTVKCVTWQPYDIVGGPARWDELRDDLERMHLRQLRRYAPNMTRETIIGSATKTPLDIERFNLHNVGGNAHGGAQLMTQLWERRPAPGWAHHRMPIAGLYQTGATTHPGGAISATPGRNAASVLLSDLGSSLEDAIAATRSLVGR